MPFWQKLIGVALLGGLLGIASWAIRGGSGESDGYNGDDYTTEHGWRAEASPDEYAMGQPGVFDGYEMSEAYEEYVASDYPERLYDGTTSYEPIYSGLDAAFAAASELFYSSEDDATRLMGFNPRVSGAEAGYCRALADAPDMIRYVEWRYMNVHLRHDGYEGLNQAQFASILADACPGVDLTPAPSSAEETFWAMMARSEWGGWNAVCVTGYHTWERSGEMPPSAESALFSAEQEYGIEIPRSVLIDHWDVACAPL